MNWFAPWKQLIPVELQYISVQHVCISHMETDPSSYTIFILFCDILHSVVSVYSQSWTWMLYGQSWRSIAFLMPTSLFVAMELLMTLLMWLRATGASLPRVINFKFPLQRHTVWRAWLFVDYSDERWFYYQFPLLYLLTHFFRLEECTFWTWERKGYLLIEIICCVIIQQGLYSLHLYPEQNWPDLHWGEDHQTVYFMYSRSDVLTRNCYSKHDCVSLIQELDLVSRVPHAVAISAHHKWNFDDLLEKMWEYLNLVRMYVL